MAAALVHFLPRFISWEWRPLRHYTEIARNLEQRIEHQRPCFGDGLFHRQHADEVIAHAQMVALGLNVRIDDLIIEKLRALRMLRQCASRRS